MQPGCTLNIGEQDTVFEIEFARSGKRAIVGVDQTILEIAEDLGLNPAYSCRQGSCGTCETRILAGKADHRDSVLSAEERAENSTMLICVSRGAPGCTKLVLDL